MGSSGGVPEGRVRAAARVHKGATQSALTGDPTRVTFGASDVVDFDDADFYSASATDRLTVPQGFGGLYLVCAGWGFAADASPTGYRYGRLIHYSAAGVELRVCTSMQTQSHASAVPGGCLSMVTLAAPTDYFVLEVTQTENATLNVLGTTRVFLSLAKVGQ